MRLPVLVYFLIQGLHLFQFVSYLALLANLLLRQEQAFNLLERQNEPRRLVTASPLDLLQLVQVYSDSTVLLLHHCADRLNLFLVELLLMLMLVVFLYDSQMFITAVGSWFRNEGRLL